MAQYKELYSEKINTLSKEVNDYAKELNDHKYYTAKSIHESREEIYSLKRKQKELEDENKQLFFFLVILGIALLFFIYISTTAL